MSLSKLRIFLVVGTIMTMFCVVGIVWACPASCPCTTIDEKSASYSGYHQQCGSSIKCNFSLPSLPSAKGECESKTSCLIDYFTTAPHSTCIGADGSCLKCESDGTYSIDHHHNGSCYTSWGSWKCHAPVHDDTYPKNYSNKTSNSC